MQVPPFYNNYLHAMFSYIQDTFCEKKMYLVLYSLREEKQPTF